MGSLRAAAEKLNLHSIRLQHFPLTVCSLAGTTVHIQSYIAL